MNETDRPDRTEALREALSRLHAGEDPQALREAFRDALDGLTPIEIARTEQEMVAQGVSRDDIRSLCDVHLDLLRKQVESVDVSTPAWHPVSILMEEHKRILTEADRLRALAGAARSGPLASGDDEALKDVSAHLRDAASHFSREENVLFPYMERYGISEPPAVMWTEHETIRRLEKELSTLADGVPGGGRAPRLAQLGSALAEQLANHIFKESKILYPSALRVIPEEDWVRIRAEFDEIGYCCFTPQAPAPPRRASEGLSERSGSADGEIRLPTGRFSREELRAVLDALPVDISFVDAADEVRYFNQTKDRIFVRSPAVIGRPVRHCHPQKSLHAVEQILASFKAGTRDEAAFWLTLGGRRVFIRYVPVRSRDGTYLGTLEVTQDITGIQGLTGEKRLLDEDGG